MYVQDASTGQGIPFASFVVSHPNGGSTAGAADEKGHINDYDLNNFTGGAVEFSSAGFISKTMSVNTAINLGGVELDEGGALAEVFVTAARKAKQNPGTIIIVLASIVVIIIFRKKLLSLIN